MKYGRFYRGEDLRAWQQQFFTHVSWRTFDPDEFREHRNELFVSIVLGGTDGLDYDGDMFLFRSSDFHQLIQDAPQFSGKDGRKEICFACGLGGTHWYVPRLRRSFAALNLDSVMDVTANRRNFAQLDTPE